MSGMNQIGIRRGDIAVLCLILLLSAALFCLDFSGGGRLRAVIYADGEVACVIDLAAVGAPYTLTVGGCTLSVRRGAVAFTEADCKDKLCVRRGELTHVGDCMACVPMRVTVLLTGDGGADAVTG